MVRIALLFLLSANLYAAEAGVDMDTAATVYQAAAVREQVRVSLRSMPAKMRRMFASDDSASLSAEQLDAVESAAARGFRVDVFEPPAIAALAAGLDAASVRDTLAFLRGNTGRRMVAADVALAELDAATLDMIASGELAAASGANRDVLFDKLEIATRSVDSAVQIYLTVARALAIGTAIGSGMDPIAAEQRVNRNADAAMRAELAQRMQEPLRRSLAYGYRDLSNADLHKMLSFLGTRAGERYTNAYVAAMNAGFDAMGRRCGEQIGESWHDLAKAQRATTTRPGAPQPESPQPASPLPASP
ncbi:MAG: hypothetical protein ACHQIL_00630 [Steroidobacterales bacterium]